MNGIEIHEKIKAQTTKMGKTKTTSEVRKEIQKETNQAHSFVNETIKKLGKLDKLLFYDQYTEDITPELLYKYQTTQNCYELIYPKEISFQCLDCTKNDIHPFILCKKCAEEHKNKKHLLLQRTSTEIENCHCGDVFMVEENNNCCSIHTKNEIYFDENEMKNGNWNDDEILSIKQNVNEIFKRVEKISEIVIPQAMEEICENILDILNGNSSHDLNLFILHIMRWLNRVVRINQIRNIIKETMKKKIKTKGRFLLTNLIVEKPNKKYKKEKKNEESEFIVEMKSNSEKDEVTVHEIFLNLCILRPQTSSYVTRFLYLILDKENQNDFIGEYRRAYATVNFHGTSLPKELGTFLDKIKVKSIIPHIINSLNGLITQNKPIKDANAMLQFTSWILADEENINEIVNKEQNLISFFELCEKMTMYPKPSDETTTLVMKIFHPIFIGVMTRLLVSNDNLDDDKKKLMEMHTRLLPKIGELLKKDNKLQRMVNDLNKIIFGRDEGRTEIDKSVFPSHFYLCSLIGYLSQMLICAKDKLTSNIFNFIGLSDDVYSVKLLLQFSYLIYTVSHDNFHIANILDVKNQKAQQMEVIDICGEITHPILYSSLLFISHACLLQIGSRDFVESIKTFAYTIGDQNLSNTSGEMIDSSIIDFINMVCSFERFGTIDEEQKYIEYMKFNMGLSDAADSINKQVKEYLDNFATTSTTLEGKQMKTNQSFMMQRKSFHPTSSKEKAVAASAPSMRNVINVSEYAASIGSDNKLKKQSKQSRSRDKGLIKKESSLKQAEVKSTSKKVEKRKSSTTTLPAQLQSSKAPRSASMKSSFSKQTNDTTKLLNLDMEKDSTILQYRKLSNKEEINEENKMIEFQKTLLKLRMEQKGMRDLGSNNERYEWDEGLIQRVDYEGSPIYYDYFFPYLNSSCNIQFKTNYINNYVLERISRGERFFFFLIVDPHSHILEFVTDLKKIMFDLADNDIVSDYKCVNSINYMFILRFLWIKISFKRKDNIMLERILQEDVSISRVLAACYGNLFADIMMLIPETTVEMLLDDILHILQQPPFGGNCLDIFRQSVESHPVGRVLFDESYKSSSIEIPPFSDKITSCFASARKEDATASFSAKKKK